MSYDSKLNPEFDTSHGRLRFVYLSFHFIVESRISRGRLAYTVGRSDYVCTAYSPLKIGCVLHAEGRACISDNVRGNQSLAGRSV